MTEFSDPETLVGDLVERAKQAGADAADAVAIRGSALTVAWRMGEFEDLDRSDATDLGLRVFVGQRQANVSTTDPSPQNLDDLVERALAMARIAPPDEYAGLAEPQDLATDIPALELDEGGEPDPQWLIDQARACEDAARVEPRITNSEGASASWGRSTIAMAASNGFSGGFSGTRSSIGLSVIAGEGLHMERDYAQTSARFRDDLEPPDVIGRRAAERTVRRLGAEKVPTRPMPVVFDPRVSGGLISHLVGAITGPSIARGTSFLKDCLGELVFDSAIKIVEDPHVRRGLRSKPFDGEGVACRRRHLIDGGRLTTWLLDCRSGRQLHLPTTGHASRGTSGPPSPSATNVWIEPGSQSPAELMADIKDGLFLTELIGFGVNQVTGDYSRGASGFRIRDGELAGSVSEITIAGNLKDMFRNMVPANDLEHRYGIDAPTVRIDGMTVAGR
jgi:PmbA protein